ncbi:MAG: N-6 DNA methylase [Nitrospiraceae bacterium]|nr:N-6 DNA methylase [Nitrospiraceae bacterium]
MQPIETFREKLQTLITKFEKDKTHYLSKGYLEAQVRIDFINPLFKALGWDIENKAHKPPHERDVIVELSPETTGRPDYNFRINGSTKFFIEAKAPSVALDDINHILQAKSYAWSTKEVYFVVLTDFEELKLFDASLKPNPRFPNEGLVFDFKYTDYLDNIERLWELSRERVEQGSLESILPRDAKSKRLRIPPDKSFLEDLTAWRTELAKDVHKRNPEFDVKLLNDVVQRLLDRIVFIRIAEDRKIRPDRELWEIVAQWKEEGKRKTIMVHLRDLFKEVNDDLNGDIFKPHACETADVDSSLLAEIIESLYFPQSRYRFDAIGVELLGSIYERYLGSTIRATPQRVKVEEKPEVRKAGGVYYTPKYIVDYIVKNTVGRLIEGKTPKQIEKIKILDPACGSGSFLLGAYQYLIDYHLKYYREHPKEAQTLHLFPYWKISPEELSLPIHEKAKILRNNIFGVDIDPQAVEITMMSLYLKALEGERGLLPKKQHLLPSLGNNIKCGNSLIGYDIFEQGQLYEGTVPELRATGRRFGTVPVAGLSDEDKSRINPFDWNSKSSGFGEIIENGGFDCVIGNPPYIQLSMTDYYDSTVNAYLTKNYSSSMGRLNTFGFFIEKILKMILAKNGLFSFIVPNTLLTQEYYQSLRQMMLKFRLGSITTYQYPVFPEAVVETIVFVIQNANPRYNKVNIVKCDNKSMLYQTHYIPQSTYLKTHSNAFLIKIDKDTLELKIKLDKTGQPLQSIANINQAIALKYDRSKSLFKECKSKNYKPVLDGRNIHRYKLEWDGYYLAYDVKNIHSCKRTDIFEAKEKLFSRRVADRLIATYDDAQFYALNTLVVITLKPQANVSLKYMLGLLNSGLLNFYYLTYLKSTKKVFSEIQARQIAQLPIRTIDFNNPSEKAIHDKLVSLVDRMLELHKKKNSLPPSAERDKIEREIAVTDEKIDDIVYVLYGVTEEERGIIEGKG